MRIGVLTGGGDCPGLNAVIRAVTKSLLRQCGAEVVGIEDGFAGLMASPPRTRALDWRSVSGILMLGGTILGTSNRANPLATEATIEQTLANARALGLDALVVIGGDGPASPGRRRPPRRPAAGPGRGAGGLGAAGQHDDHGHEHGQEQSGEQEGLGAHALQILTPGDEPDVTHCPSPRRR